MLWVLFWLFIVWWFVWTVIGTYLFCSEVVKKSRRLPKDDSAHLDVGFEYLQCLGLAALLGWLLFPCYCLSNHFAKEENVDSTTPH